MFFKLYFNVKIVFANNKLLFKVLFQLNYVHIQLFVFYFKLIGTIIISVLSNSYCCYISSPHQKGHQFMCNRLYLGHKLSFFTSYIFNTQKNKQKTIHRQYIFHVKHKRRQARSANYLKTGVDRCCCRLPCSLTRMVEFCSQSWFHRAFQVYMYPCGKSHDRNS